MDGVIKVWGFLVIICGRGGDCESYLACSQMPANGKELNLSLAAPRLPKCALVEVQLQGPWQDGENEDCRIPPYPRS